MNTSKYTTTQTRMGDGLNIEEIFLLLDGEKVIECPHCLNNYRDSWSSCPSCVVARKQGVVN